MPYDRVYNFSAGPSMLPVPVLEECRADLMNYKGSGQSVMEMSHRSKVYDEIIVAAQQLFREVMGIPDNYKVLFLQGGATLQFAMVPTNLMTHGKADYVKTGNFSSSAAKEAAKFGTVNIAASTEAENYSRIPRQSELKLDPDADYLHICFNNTIYGSVWPYIPETGNVPLVADMSSCILSEPVDVSRFALIYAGAQKNIAPAGLTIVIVRDDMLGRAPANAPVMLNYKTLADKDSMYNTPPCWSIYVCKLVLEYIKNLGGLSVMQQMNQKKAKLLYDYLENSRLFHLTVQAGSRSMMNVTFRTDDDDCNARFVKEAAARGMVNLKGHRLVGGMRASIYNAMPYEGIEALVKFLGEFEAANK